MTELNQNTYRIIGTTTNTMALSNLGGSRLDYDTFAAYTSGGTAQHSQTTLVNLHHLEGETVSVMMDGKTHPNLTVSSGAITFTSPTSAAVIQVGMNKCWFLQTLRVEAGAADGTSQGKTKRINKVIVRLKDTLGFEYGPRLINEFDISAATAADPVVLTTDTHTLRTDDVFTVRGVVGMTELNNNQYRVLNTTPTTITVGTVDGSNLDGSTFTAYSSGGVVRTSNEQGDSLNLDEHPFGYGQQVSGATPLATEDVKVEWPGGYEQSGRMYFTSDSVYPVQIQAIMPQLHTQDTA